MLNKIESLKLDRCPFYTNPLNTVRIYSPDGGKIGVYFDGKGYREVNDSRHIPDVYVMNIRRHVAEAACKADLESAANPPQEPQLRREQS